MNIEYNLSYNVHGTVRVTSYELVHSGLWGEIVKIENDTSHYGVRAAQAATLGLR